jgi:hypothetical protein
MLFLSPLTLIGLLLVGLPLVIHLLVRQRARRLDFPSLAFLRETPSFKFFPRHIRQPLLLALRAAAIILLVLGLARPLLTLNNQAHASVRFILMDASLSMRTRGRAEAARERARTIINKLAEGERAEVIAFSSEAQTLAEATSDRTKLLEAIERYQPTGGAADYGAGFKEVSAQLRREPQATGEADIISDFQRAGLEDELHARDASALRIVTYSVGAQVERSAFLIDEDVRRTERGVELSATEIVSEADGRKGTRRTWTIGASEGEGNGVEWRTESNGQMTGSVKVLEPDDFDADDERFFAFSPPRDARVLLIEDEGNAALFLRVAFEAASADGKNLRLDHLRELPGKAADLSPYSLIVLTLHGAPREAEVKVLAEYARAGGTLWLFLARNLDAEAWNTLAHQEKGSDLPFESLARIDGRALTFGTADTDAPQLRAMNESALSALRAVRVNTGYALAPRDSAETLMRWNVGSPAFVSMQVGEGHIVLLATSPERASSEMGSSPAFPILASSILHFASAMREPPSNTIGEAIHLNVAPETSVKITNMEGRMTETKARELVRQPLTYFSEPGVYRLEFSGVQKFAAFNPPVAESERTLATEDHLKQYFSVEKTESAVTASESNRREAAERGSSTWRYFLAAAFLLMIAELFVAMRGRQVAAPE